jgi:hypothetical protein
VAERYGLDDVSKPYRKIEIWGVRFFVIKETEFEMLVAARMSLIPAGVVAGRAGNGWGVLWLELPAGFHRPEQPDGESGSELSGMPTDEEG